jgi:hypothetical protein
MPDLFLYFCEAELLPKLIKNQKQNTGAKGFNLTYVIIKVWKMYNGKIEVVSFATKSGKKLTIGVKCMVNVKK